jgi:hypothetical protein
MKGLFEVCYTFYSPMLQVIAVRKSPNNERYHKVETIKNL